MSIYFTSRHVTQKRNVVPPSVRHTLHIFLSNLRTFCQRTCIMQMANLKYGELLTHTHVHDIARPIIYSSHTGGHLCLHGNAHPMLLIQAQSWLVLSHEQKWTNGSWNWSFVAQCDSKCLFGSPESLVAHQMTGGKISQRWPNIIKQIQVADFSFNSGMYKLQIYRMIHCLPILLLAEIHKWYTNTSYFQSSFCNCYNARFY